MRFDKLQQQLREQKLHYTTQNNRDRKSLRQPAGDSLPLLGFFVLPSCYHTFVGCGFLLIHSLQQGYVNSGAHGDESVIMWILVNGARDGGRVATTDRCCL